MGYYSRVSITLDEGDFSTLIQKFGNTYPICDAQLYCHRSGSSPAYTLAWDCIKWYGTPEIDAIMDFLDTVPARFIRVGEESGDIEVCDTDPESRFWDFTMPECTIYIDGDTETLEEYMRSRKFGGAAHAKP